MSQYIVQGIFAVAGIIALLAAILDWNWFFTARNTQFIVQNVGRRQARLFYGVLGVILIGTSIFFFLNTPPVTQKQKIADEAMPIRDFPILLIQTILRPKIPYIPSHLVR